MRLLSLCLIASACVAQTVATDHGSTNRTGWNSAETTLTPGVITAGFGKVATLGVDGPVYPQPLYLSQVSAGGATRDVIIGATMDCSLYAFDGNTYAQVWRANLCSPYTGTDTDFYGGAIGCLAAPAADVSLGYIFAACLSATTETVYKVAIADGSVAASVNLSGTYQSISFAPLSNSSLLRAGLTIANGNVYAVTTVLTTEDQNWNGWVFSYAESNLAQQAVWMTTTSASLGGGGIWQSSGGMAVDGSGNLVFATGNGVYDGTNNYANSIVKLTPSLTVADWYTPSNYATLSSGDLDMSSGRVLLIPNTTLAVLGEKDFQVYVVDTTCMGALGGTNNGCGAALQVFPTNGSGTTSFFSGVYGGAFCNNVAYMPNVAGDVYAFQFSSGAFNTTPIATSASTYPFPGAQLSCSSNGSSNAIVWAMTLAASGFGSEQVGTVRAWNPTTLAEYWNSGTFRNSPAL
jgi:hypothetical protein